MAVRPQRPIFGAGIPPRRNVGKTGQGFQQQASPQGFAQQPIGAQQPQQNFSQLATALGDSPEVRILRQRAEKRKAEAQAKAAGEAQRRGFVSGTGTSDIEFALKRSAVSPIEEAAALAEAGVISRGVESERGRQFRRGERLGGQEFQTGERLGGEQFRTGERLGLQDFTTGERLGTQQFRTGERKGTQQFLTERQQREAELEGIVGPGGQLISRGEFGAAPGTGQQFFGRAALGERERGQQFGLAQLMKPPKPRKPNPWAQGLSALAGGVGAGVGAGVTGGFFKPPVA